jgi:excisionase family DNA binding protein
VIHEPNPTKRIKEVAKELQVSERTVHAWIQKGILRVYRVNRLVFLDLEEVHEDIRRYSSRQVTTGSAQDTEVELETPTDR